MTFAKLENGILKRCPNAGMSGKGYRTNLPLYYERFPEKAYADGWLELVETVRPEGNYYSTYAIISGKVVQEWCLTPDPEPYVDPMEKLRADVDYILFMGGYDE